MAEDKKTCFVITPIGDNNSDIRRHIDGIIDQAIIPALGDKYEITVAHRKYEIGSINDRVVMSVYEADLVIANLTGTNPNVMYELAIRYSFGKPAIVIAEDGTKLPFDVIDENTAFYINDPAGAAELKNKICEFESGIDFSKTNYGPVHKVLKRIPLINEVESGKDVSSEKLLEYFINRFDSLEKSLKVRTQNIRENEKNRKVRLVLRKRAEDDEEINYNEVESLLLFNEAHILERSGSFHEMRCIFIINAKDYPRLLRLLHEYAEINNLEPRISVISANRLN